MKLVKKVHKGETVSGVFAYLNQLQNVSKARCTAMTAEEFASIDQVDDALKSLSSICISETVKAINSAKGSKKQIANETMALEIVKMSELHIKVMTFVIFRNHIKDFSDVNLQGHMTNCCALMGLTWL
jgi:regulator of PEP synthase PpsR (kinase-PPPase family)